VSHKSTAPPAGWLRGRLRRGWPIPVGVLALVLSFGTAAVFGQPDASSIGSPVGSGPAFAAQPAAILAGGPSLPGAGAPTASASPSPKPAAKPSPKPSPKPKLTRRPAPTGSPEHQVLVLVNQQRSTAGCHALREDTRLDSAAFGHSKDMADNHYFSHVGRYGSTFVDREAAAGYPRNSAGGENIAEGYPTATAVMNAWMHSPGHRANILDCSFKAIGLGVAHDSSGAAYWTQDFGRS
jgi:uncharacterized protein YkwD